MQTLVHALALHILEVAGEHIGSAKGLEFRRCVRQHVQAVVAARAGDIVVSGWGRHRGTCGRAAGCFS